jgi:N-acetylneuraminic acid mutarotase
VKLPKDEPAPCARSGHSASILNGTMFVFGGKNQELEKLNDLWSFNIPDQVWKQIVYREHSYVPLSRSGHVTEMYRNQLVLFGGIHEVTRELNDLCVFSFKTNEWITL